MDLHNTSSAPTCGCNSCTTALQKAVPLADSSDYCGWEYKDDVKCIESCATSRCSGLQSKEDQQKCLEECAESCKDKKHPWWWWAMIAFGIVLLLAILFSMMGGRGQAQDVIVAAPPTTYYM